ncbi:site-specific DNA-methyltransferase [Anaerostipes hadrus]|uniref:site-specific DNA-methyltransferase n=1 Tax=Clostridia TaxID=186801 RepID=UPI001D004C0E|nr:site-specific DNA-methyltransferase [Anaerostipes hadrus]MCB5543053.1 site-specific DNA-methyltransferase [Anaerostipes hadrus]
MEKMRMESVDMTAQNIEKLGELFPNCITEMLDEEKSTDKEKVYKKAVNFELLKQMLSNNVIDGNEAYEFTWVGKKEAIVEANKPIRKTLRPCPEESVDWDNTENLYIEGDNLEVLKLLQESYLGKIKMIYIDPPYNTGSDFIYKDNFKIKKKEYEEALGEIDEDGNRMQKNTDSNGRFHSDWCSMIYSRLLLSRNLLRDDGVIFISIDDCEVENLKKICDEVFGANNFIAQLIWQNKKGGGNDSKYIAVEHEYIISYARNKELLEEFYESYSQKYIKRYKEKDEIGRYYWDTFKRKSGKQYYPIECPDGTILEYDEDGNAISWLRSKNRFNEDIKKGEIRIIKNKNKWSVQFKQRIPKGKTPRSIFTTNTVIDNKGTTSTGAGNVYEYFKKDVFSNPKPVELIKFLLGFGMTKDDIVLDFFSGSGTTAEAVFRSNLEGEKYKFILVQVKEDIDLKRVGGDANAKRIITNAISILDELEKPHVISELAKERIRRVGVNIRKENPLIAQSLDLGFRVMKLDDTNMTDVYYSANEYNQEMLYMLESNIKSDRKDIDILFECLLEWGLPLSLPYSSEQIEGYTIHNYNDGDLIACFNENISKNIIEEIAKRRPLRAVFRDNGFIDSATKINVDEIFKLLSPDTNVKVI